MKTTYKTNSLVLKSLLVIALGLLPLSAAHAQIFISSLTGNSIGEYNFDGSVINASLITGLNNPAFMAISGSDIFVVNAGNGTIGEYTTSGATVNASLISGLSGPQGIAISGTNLFIAEQPNASAGASFIDEYTTSGTLVNGSLVSGLTGVAGLAVSGSDLFVVNNSLATIGKYSTSGATENASLISGLTHPTGLWATETDLFVTGDNSGGGGSNSPTSEFTTSGATVSNPLFTTGAASFGVQVAGPNVDAVVFAQGLVVQYNTTTGTSTNLITGLVNPIGIVVAVPEPSTWALLLGGLGLMAFGYRVRRARV